MVWDGNLLASDDEVVLIGINDNLGAFCIAIELLQLEIPAFVWIGTHPHAWADVLVINGDEESLAVAVF